VSFETLIEELSASRTALGAAKLAGLSSMNAEEASLFAGVWRELDDTIRRKLIEELAGLAEDNVELNFDRVFLLALDDADAEVRRAAIEGLWEHEDRDLIDPLVRLLDGDSDARVRAEAALALGRYVLRGEYDQLRRSDADRVDAALRSTVTDPTEVAEVRGRALEALGPRSDDWVRDLIEDAHDSDDRRLRISAVHAMGRSADPAWLDSLYTELASDDPEMRYEAVTAIGSIADREAVPHLPELLRDDDAEVQEAAIAALGQIGGPEAKEALQDLLSEGDERVREAVVAALDEVDFAADPLAFNIQR
jgi:HEAT repeat protein